MKSIAAGKHKERKEKIPFAFSALFRGYKIK
jgi:hypothetical protein